MTTAQCEICGLDAPVSSFYLGWGGYVCDSNPECRPPMGPRQREVATLTTHELDSLEWLADEQERTMTAPEIDHAVLRALIDATRAALAMEAPVYFLGKVEFFDVPGPIMTLPATRRAAAYELVERELRELKNLERSGHIQLRLVEYDASHTPDTVWSSWDHIETTLLAAVDAAKKRRP